MKKIFNGVGKRRFLFLLFFIIVTQISLNAYSQEKKITFSLKNASLKEIISEIRKSSDYDFVYRDVNLESFTRRDVAFKDATVEQTLTDCLKGTDLSYEINGKTIIIRKKAVSQEEKRLKTITGKVSDEQGNALPGVTVIIKGTTLGTATGAAGEYKLEIPDDGEQILIFSFIGMKTQEITVGSKTELDVKLVEDSETLEDVVVTGYANIRKESFTGSSTTIKRDDLLKVSNQNLIKTLQVFEPSFKIAENNKMGSDPNTMPDFYIRGRSGTSELKELDQLTTDDISQFSLANNPSAPIFILDGFEVPVFKIYDLDMDRIESVTILKDAAATAIYGSRAANGVIVIETIAPKAGDIQISYSGTLAISIPDLNSYDLLNSAEILEAEVAAGLYKGETSQELAYSTLNYAEHLNPVLRGVDTDWLSKAVNTQTNQKHYVYINGGSHDLRWGVDLNLTHNNGVMKESFRNVAGAGITVDYRYKTLQIKNQVSINTMKSKDSPYGSFSDYVGMKPYLEPYDASNRLIKSYELNYVLAATTQNINNPLYEATLKNFSKDKYIDFADNLSVRWDITNHFMLKGTFSASYNIEDQDDFTDPASGTYKNRTALKKGYLAERDFRTKIWNANALLSYQQSVADHSFNLAIGVEASETSKQAQYAYYEGFASGDYASSSYAADIVSKPTFKDSNSRRFGCYLQYNYSYKNIYMLDLSGRLDGSSAFGTEKKIAPFWSVGLGLNIHNYDFMKKQHVCSLFKIAASYGLTGKANFNPYQARTTYEMLFDSDYATSMGMVLKALGNENLKWERSKTFNLRTEMGFLKNRVTLKLDMYRTKTIDQCETVSIPTSSGFSSYMSNLGEIENKGLEALINYRVYSSKNWDVYLFANGSHNVNTILKVGEALKDYNNKVDEYHESYSSETESDAVATPLLKYEEGSSLTAIYGMRSLGIDPATGKEVYLNRDGSMTDEWKSSEQQRIGDYEPKLSGSLGFNVRYKQLTLYATFLYRLGGQQYNETLRKIENLNLYKYNGDRRVLTQRWQKPGDISTLKSIADRLYTTRSTSRLVQDENTLSFNSLTVGYEFEKKLLKKIGLNRLQLQLNMQNVFNLSSIKIERGTTYPFARTVNISLNIGL